MFDASGSASLSAQHFIPQWSAPEALLAALDPGLVLLLSVASGSRRVKTEGEWGGWDGRCHEKGK